jgi:hypothetical protein
LAVTDFLAVAGRRAVAAFVGLALVGLGLGPGGFFDAGFALGVDFDFVLAAGFGVGARFTAA